MTKLKDYLLILLFTGIALIIGLIETIAGKSFEDDWLDVHVYSNENHGQGRMKDNDHDDLVTSNYYNKQG